jgi:hypothetical protein
MDSEDIFVCGFFGFLIAIILFAILGQAIAKSECRDAISSGANVVWLDRKFMNFDPYCKVEEKINGQTIYMSADSWNDYMNKSK